MPIPAPPPVLSGRALLAPSESRAPRLPWRGWASSRRSWSCVHSAVWAGVTSLTQGPRHRPDLRRVLYRHLGSPRSPTQHRAPAEQSRRTSESSPMSRRLKGSVVVATRGGQRPRQWAPLHGYVPASTPVQEMKDWRDEQVEKFGGERRPLALAPTSIRISGACRPPFCTVGCAPSRGATRRTTRETGRDSG